MYDYGFDDIEDEIWDLISQSDEDRIVIYLADDSYDEAGTISTDSDEMFFAASSLTPSGCGVQGRPYMYRQINGTDHRYQTLLLTVSNTSGEYNDLLYAIQEDLEDRDYENWSRNDGNLLVFAQ